MCPHFLSHVENLCFISYLFLSVVLALLICICLLRYLLWIWFHTCWFKSRTKKKTSLANFENKLKFRTFFCVFNGFLTQNISGIHRCKYAQHFLRANLSDLCSGPGAIKLRERYHLLSLVLICTGCSAWLKSGKFLIYCLYKRQIIIKETSQCLYGMPIKWCVIVEKNLRLSLKTIRKRKITE